MTCSQGVEEEEKEAVVELKKGQACRVVLADQFGALSKHNLHLPKTNLVKSLKFY